MKIFIYAVIILSTTLISCSGLAIKEKIVDNYYFIASDDFEGCILSYHKVKPTDVLGSVNYGGIIDAAVFAAGYNAKYMIVKQHPCDRPFHPDKNITNYYILPLKEEMDWRTKNGLIGPLTLEEFSVKEKELHIENIAFTNVIKELE